MDQDRKYRYCYSTVGYGVFSLLGERYRMGRIEVFDREDGSGYQVHEGFYCMPFEAAAKFEDWIEGLETDLPIHFDIGSVEWCNEECARELNIDPKLMHDPETKKEYYSKKNDAYARERGYIDWNDLLKHSKWVDKGDQKISDTEDKLLGGPQDTRDERVIDPAVYERGDNTTIEDIKAIQKEIKENERQIRELEEKRFNNIVKSLK